MPAGRARNLEAMPVLKLAEAYPAPRLRLAGDPAYEGRPTAIAARQSH